VLNILAHLIVIILYESKGMLVRNIFITIIIILSCFGMYKICNQPKGGDTITLGTMSGWPPYVSINDKGDYEGLDIDVAMEIARRLNKQLLIKDMDTAALITALNQGKVDFIMTGLCITHDRLQKIAMIPYQGEEITQLPLVFWNTIPKGVSSLADLKNIPGAVICVEAGSAQESFLNQFSGFEIKQIDPLTSILEIKYGKALATLLEPALFKELKAKYPELQALTIELGQKDKIMGNGIGIAKTNTQLINAIGSIIDQLRSSGFIAASQKRWLKE
jgi:arginine/lysine/histidine transporter system substrate-binding protein